MPAPPFSQVKDKSDTRNLAIRSDWNTDDTGWSGYIVQPGINVVGQPTSSGTLRVAHRIVGTTDDHPLVRDLQLMIQSSRYITSRKEYERMVNASTQSGPRCLLAQLRKRKRSVGHVDCDVLRSRRRSNRYFSGVLRMAHGPGYGAHRVWGSNKVPRVGQRMVDLRRRLANALVFRFLHVEHPWDSEFYVLSRSIQFRSPWDRMVTNWRNGRIKAD